MGTGTSFMEAAAQLGIKGMKRGHGGPFGAVIVKGDKIVGRGWNQTFKKTDPSAHAEIQAIRDACKRLKTLELAGCVIYSSGEPCPMCLSAIYWSMLDSVYFANTKEESAVCGFDDARIYQELKLPWQARTLSMVHFPHKTAVLAFQKWEALKKKNLEKG